MKLCTYEYDVIHNKEVGYLGSGISWSKVRPEKRIYRTLGKHFHPFLFTIYWKAFTFERCVLLQDLKVSFLKASTLERCVLSQDLKVSFFKI